MAEQVIDVRGSARAVRRSWRLVTATVVLGTAAGAAYLLHDPPRYRASSLVLLPAAISAGAGSGSSTANPITTDARIATSAAVLAPAGRTVDRTLTLADLQASVSASATATSVLEITAAGSTAHQAMALADATAKQLVKFVTTGGVGFKTGTVSGLQAESAQLSRQISDVDREIATVSQRIAAEGASSPSGQQDSTLVAKLTSNQSALELQLSSVKSQIAAAQLGQISADQGTEVIQTAHSAAPPAVTSYALPLLGGAAGGLAVGVVLALARRRRDPRVRTRDGLAEAIGAPVVLSLPAAPRRSLGEWVQLLDAHEAGAVERWSTRKALLQLGVGDGRASTCTVLVLAHDPAAAALAAQMALAALASGVDVRFSVEAADATAAGLRAACARFEHGEHRSRPGLRLHDGVPPPDAPDGGLRVDLVVLDADRLALPPPTGPSDAVTVLSVSSGLATAEQLAAVAIAASDAGTPVTGVLVANPELDDQSAGRAGAGRGGSLDELRPHVPTRHEVAEGSAR